MCIRLIYSIIKLNLTPKSGILCKKKFCLSVTKYFLSRFLSAHMCLNILD